VSKNAVDSEGKSVNKNRGGPTGEAWLALKKDFITEKGTKRLLTGQRERVDFSKRNPL
jgi:hypothetical protein